MKGKRTMEEATWSWNVVAEGQFRYVAQGTYTKGPMAGQKCAIKWFKSGLVFESSYYEHDIKVMEATREIVRAFNSAGLINKTLFVNECSIWTVKSQGDENKGKILLEPWIPGLFTKFNSNSGWADNSFPSMQALSHFSYDYSDGQLLLCDLQGGRYADSYLLTDPVIMSETRSYGPADLGSVGISNFFFHHRCNEFCSPHWRKPKAMVPSRTIGSVKGTSFMSSTQSFVGTQYRLL